MTGRNLSSSTNKSLWRKTRKELNSRPFLSLREQRKPSETKRVPFQVRSEAWSMERPSFWSKCSKTWHHRFPPYIFLLFSSSLIIGWTECKRQYEQRGSMPVGAWWRSAAKCIVVNQQLHGSKSKQWVAMLEDIHHHTFFSWAKSKISTAWETTNQFTIASTDEIEHCVCLFSSADFWRDCHLHNCVHKVPPQYPWDPIVAAMVRGQNFFNGKITLKKWRFDHPLWSRKMAIWKNWPGFRKTKNLWTSIRTSNSGSLPPEKTAKNCDCPIIVGTGACLGHNDQMVFLSFFQWLEQRSQSQQSDEIRYRKKQFLFMTNKKRKQILSRSRLSWKVGPKWVENGNELKYPICMCGLSAHPEEKRPVRMTDLDALASLKKITSRGNAGRNPWKKSSVTRRY